MHPFNFSCIVENAKQENAIVIIINYELHESPKWQTYFPFKTVEFEKKKSNRILQDIPSLDIGGRLPSVVVKLFMQGTTSENIWLSKYHHIDQH